MLAFLLRFALLLALLLIGSASVHAQNAPQHRQRTITGLGDPEPAEPRYAALSQEVEELREQVQTLNQAYQEMLTRYNQQVARVRELELRYANPQPPGQHRARQTNQTNGSR
jgi:cell division protein FtsB